MTLLTSRGRALLQAKLSSIEDELRRASGLAAAGDEGEPALRLAQLTLERSAIEAALRDARPVESLPEDPGLVLVGDRVDIRLGSRGPVESFVVVHPVEATVDDTRISTASPLGQALLGGVVGADVKVPAPGGTYRCTILRAERD